MPSDNRGGRDGNANNDREVWNWAVAPNNLIIFPYTGGDFNDLFWQIVPFP